MGAIPKDVILREADEAEVNAVGMSGQQALALSISKSLHSFEVWVGNDLCAWWGYSPVSVLGDTVCAWMLTTPAADKYPLQIGRASIVLFNDLHRAYPRIVVNVDPLHELAIKWLTWLGFEYHCSLGGYDCMKSERGATRWVH